MSKFEQFLQETSLTFEEYEQWFLSLKKGDEVLRYQLRKLSCIVREASSTGIELESDFGLYQLTKNDIVYFVSARNFFKAEYFPIPLEKQIELIKQKRQPKLHLEVGEVYEDGNGMEWTVETTDLLSKTFNVFICRCFGKNGEARLYARDGKFTYKSSLLDLVSKKGVAEMPIKEELDVSSEIAQLFESCQKRAREFAKACDDEKYRLATENDALKLTIEQSNKQLKDLEEKCKDRENRVSFLCVALKDEQENLERERAHHIDICNLKDEIEEENSNLKNQLEHIWKIKDDAVDENLKLAEENKQLKQKLDQLKSFLEPDHK